MVEKGAKIDVSNKNGETPISLLDKNNKDKHIIQ